MELTPLRCPAQLGPPAASALTGLGERVAGWLMCPLSAVTAPPRSATTKSPSATASSPRGHRLPGRAGHTPRPTTGPWGLRPAPPGARAGSSARGQTTDTPRLRRRWEATLPGHADAGLGPVLAAARNTSSLRLSGSGVGFGERPAFPLRCSGASGGGRGSGGSRAEAELTGRLPGASERSPRPSGQAAHEPQPTLEAITRAAFCAMTNTANRFYSQRPRHEHRGSRSPAGHWHRRTPARDPPARVTFQRGPGL